jgi:hypothetical protein
MVEEEYPEERRPETVRAPANDEAWVVVPTKAEAYSWCAVPVAVRVFESVHIARVFATPVPSTAPAPAVAVMSIGVEPITVKGVHDASPEQEAVVVANVPTSPPVPV